MKIFIRATGNISPQPTFGHPPLLTRVIDHTGTRLRSLEPEYKNIIEGKWIRRMSRIIRMGSAAALECLQEAGIIMPGAIITGTAYGCLEDTGTFLSKMVEQNEELLTPTAFIQSTHNTVGAQIALMLGCTNYNNTYVHRGFSFESALLDGMLFLKEGEAYNVLVGAVDEITDYSHAILSRFGLYKSDSRFNSQQLYSEKSAGSIAGEGASFLLLSNEPAAENYAELRGLHTFYKPNNAQAVEFEIARFLEGQDIMIEDIDLIITGRNGDISGDEIFDRLDSTIFHGKAQTNFKHLCGEYPTAASFACWLAAHIIKNGNLPETLPLSSGNIERFKNVLIYNHSLGIHHSLLLLSAC